VFTRLGTNRAKLSLRESFGKVGGAQISGFAIASTRCQQNGGYQSGARPFLRWEEHDKPWSNDRPQAQREGRSLNGNRRSRIGTTVEVGFKLTYQIEGTSGRRAITSSCTHGRCVTSARSLPDRVMSWSQGCIFFFFLKERKVFITS